MLVELGLDVKEVDTMKLLVNILFLSLLMPVASLVGVVSVFAQQPQTPDPQQLQDAIVLLQRESAQNQERARQAEMSVAKLQRDLSDAQKAAAACAPKKEDKK